MLTKNPVGQLANGVFYCLLIRRLLIRGLLIPGLLILARPLSADTVTPFATRDQNPLVMIYGLPTAVPAQLIGASRSRFSASLNVSNTLNVQDAGGESLFVDVETYQLNLVVDHGISDDWMVRLKLPFIRHEPGFMDDWIDRYHDLLGLPEHLRPLYPNDRLDIRYSLNGNEQLSLQQSANGLGDLSLQSAWQALEGPEGHLSYWLSLKLPSGDDQKLTGSGSTDLALWLAGDMRLAGETWAYGNLGMVLMTDSDVLPQLHRRSVPFATAGIQFHPWQPVQLRAQLDMHGAFYDSSLKFLGDVVQLTFGGSVLLGPRSTLDIAVAEDIQSSASPDVNFNFTLRQLF